MSMFAYFIVIWAMTQAPIALIAASAKRASYSGRSL
jgi:hypothetical protein